MRNLLQRLVFETADSKGIDILLTITEQYNYRVHVSTKLTPIQASLKLSEGLVYRKLIDERKKIKTKVSSKQSRPNCRFKENKKVVQLIGLRN